MKFVLFLFSLSFISCASSPNYVETDISVEKALDNVISMAKSLKDGGLREPAKHPFKRGVLYIEKSIIGIKKQEPRGIILKRISKAERLLQRADYINGRYYRTWRWRTPSSDVGDRLL